MAKFHSNPKTIHHPHNNSYSHVVVVEEGRLVFIAGQAAIDVDGSVVGGADVGEQARQAFRNLRAAVESLGGTPADIVKLTTFVVGHAPTHLAAVAAARDEILAIEELPASTLTGVTSLATDELLVEVEAVAVID